MSGVQRQEPEPDQEQCISKNVEEQEQGQEGEFFKLLRHAFIVIQICETAY